VGSWDLDTVFFGTRFRERDFSHQGFVNSQGFDVATWSGDSKDYIFMFTRREPFLRVPDAHFDNAYHIMVGEYFSYRPDSSYFKLSEAGLRLYGHPDAAARLLSRRSPGLFHRMGGASLRRVLEGALSCPLAILEPSPRNEVTMLPVINRRLYRNPRIDAVLSTDDHLKIVVEAQDRDGTPLSECVHFPRGVPSP